MVAFSLKDAAPAQLRPLKRLEYEALAAMGTFDGERVELIRGVILTMTPPDPPHAKAVDLLNRRLSLAIQERALVRVQQPLSATDDSSPEPDVAVVAEQDYGHAHPRTAMLAIEVAASSLKYDRTVKADLYAQAGVTEYWIVNIVDQQVEVLRDPVVGRYRGETIYRRGERITLLAFPDVAIAVDDVMPTR
jgi:Uma2 family endonuclease